MSMQQVTLAGRQVGQMGFGLMQLTWTPEIPDQETSFKAMKAAADAGCTAWSSAFFYGNFHEAPEKGMDNIRLIGAFFKKYPEYKDKIVLVIKGGLKPDFSLTIDLDYWRAQLKEAKEILGDKKMDVVSIARNPPAHSTEEIAKALMTLRDEGWFEHIGTSETSKETMEAFGKFFPVAMAEIEVSLWSYEPPMSAVVKYCAEQKIPVFCYSPLGRGFISRKWKTPEDVPKGSFQARSPRFQGEAFYNNLKLVDQLDELAAKKGVKTTQLALAWITSLSPYNVPIPGSSNPGRIAENAEAVNIKLTEEDLKGINETLASFEVAGGRYDEHQTAVLMR